MAEVQVPPGELRERRRSADTDVCVDSLFSVQFYRILRGGAANPQSGLGSGIPEESSLQRALIHSTTPHEHLPHSKSTTPPLPPVLDTHKSFEQKVVNFPDCRWFPRFCIFRPSPHGLFLRIQKSPLDARKFLENSRTFSTI
jgi:hypothetical protein